MSKLTLVILAAGLGSRYGGLKQIEPVGNNGESIIDFSIYDAIAAGFSKVVLIIRKEHHQAFENQLSKRIRPFIEVQYAFQELNDLPIAITVDPKREKPWGTTHALLACRDVLDGPFAIINADDYYGKDAFIKMANFLTNEVNESTFSMIGYHLKNTTTTHGAVTRGVCEQQDGYLSQIREISKIERYNEQHRFLDEFNQWQQLDNDSLVSMNFWGFTPSVIPAFNEIFSDFLLKDSQKDPLKSEHVLPTAVASALKKQLFKVKIIASVDQWYGITYPLDRQLVVDSLLTLKQQGAYPFDLWEKEKS